jgi:hypothetical protein
LCRDYRPEWQIFWACWTAGDRRLVPGSFDLDGDPPVLEKVGSGRFGTPCWRVHRALAIAARFLLGGWWLRARTGYRRPMALFSRDTKVEALKRAPLFEGLSRKQLGELARVTEDVDFRAGKVLCREGQRGQEFFVIMDGEVEVTRGGKKLATRGRGEFFGEIALVEDVPRTATVTATTPLRFFVLTRRSFLRLLDEQPKVERKVMRALARRLVSISDELSL